MNAVFCLALVAVIAVVAVRSEHCMGHDTTHCDHSMCGTGFTMRCEHTGGMGGVCSCMDDGMSTAPPTCQTNHDCPHNHHTHCPNHGFRSCVNGDCLCHHQNGRPCQDNTECPHTHAHCPNHGGRSCVQGHCLCH